MRFADFQEQNFDGLLQAGIYSCYLSLATGQKMGDRATRRVKPCNYDIPSPLWRLATPCIERGLQAPVSQQSLSDISAPLLFMHLYFPISPVLPSHPLSGSMCCSLSLLLPDLSRIVVRAPGAGQTDIPPLRSDRQREGKKERRRKMRERKDCVSLSSFSPPLGKVEFLYFQLKNAGAISALMSKLYLVQMEPGRNNTGEKT